MLLKLHIPFRNSMILKMPLMRYNNAAYWLYADSVLISTHRSQLYSPY